MYQNIFTDNEESNLYENDTSVVIFIRHNDSLFLFCTACFRNLTIHMKIINMGAWVFPTASWQPIFSNIPLQMQDTRPTQTCRLIETHNLNKRKHYNFLCYNDLNSYSLNSNSYFFIQ